MTARTTIAAISLALIAVPSPATGQTQAASPPAPDTVPDYVSKSLSLYEPAPSVFDVREAVARWESDGSLDSASDSLFVARMWRRALETGEALAWLPGPASVGVTGESTREQLESLVQLERARILLPGSAAGRAGLGSRERLEVRGASDFWAACSSATPAVEQELWLDLRALFTPEEREAWEAAAPDAKCEVVRSALDERAVRSAQSAGERLAVH